MKLIPQGKAKARHAAMTITQAQRSEGNRGPGCRSSRVPAKSEAVGYQPKVKQYGDSQSDGEEKWRRQGRPNPTPRKLSVTAFVSDSAASQREERTDKSTVAC